MGWSVEGGGRQGAAVAGLGLVRRRRRRRTWRGRRPHPARAEGQLLLHSCIASTGAAWTRGGGVGDGD